MRSHLRLALASLFLSACADDLPAGNADGTGDSGTSTGTPGQTSSAMTTAPTSDTMSAGTADADSGTSMVADSSGPGPADSSSGGPATGSSGESGPMTDGGSSDSGSSSGGSTSGGSSSGGMGSSSGGSSDSMGSSSGSSSSGGSTSGMVTMSGSMSGSTSGTTTGGAECMPVACGSAVYECGDCIDNDGDDAIDGVDVECISPCDDDESSFATGIPGDNIDLCHQDCFFDGNSGAGDDGCNWWLACDPLDPDMGQCNIPGGQTCPTTQPQSCIDNCQVPNGCDCFGCCTVTVDGVEHDILIGAPDCSLDNFAACPECSQVEACTDPCDPTDCELCFGETELPPGCTDPTCPDGQTACLVDADCPETYFCQTGCCEFIPL